MSFRAFLLLIRVFGPAGMLLMATSMFVNNDTIAVALKVVGAMPFLIGAMGGLYLVMRGGPSLKLNCPFCGKQGIVGKGGPSGWWLRCDDCGNVQPTGVLGLNFQKQAIEEYEEEDG